MPEPLRTVGFRRESGGVANGDAPREDLKGTTYELFIIAISILSIMNLALLAPEATADGSLGTALVELERLQEQQQRAIAALRARVVELEPAATRD